MKTLTLETEIGQDGHLRLDVLTELPPGKAEIVIVATPAGNGREHHYDFSDLTGRLQWQGDAVAEQRRLRNEW